MKKVFEDVEVEDICAELFKVSNRLRILANLSHEVVPYPKARDLLMDLSFDIRELSDSFLELA